MRSNTMAPRKNKRAGEACLDVVLWISSDVDGEFAAFTFIRVNIKLHLAQKKDGNNS